jgi:rRNA maturation endonuclease Nob1
MTKHTEDCVFNSGALMTEHFEMILCKECGQKKPDVHFCPYCGVKLE